MGDNVKPLGQKSYGSIGHLPGSRLGPGDHKVTDGQERILCEKTRDKHDVVIVQEKLDGSNVCIANIDGNILALSRAGYLASTSPYPLHHRFAEWVDRRGHDHWRQAIAPGSRLCGEWLVQAHGTRYALPHEPFVAFDRMTGMNRALYDDFLETCEVADVVTAKLVSHGGPCSVQRSQEILGVSGFHGADFCEGAVWRVERKGKVDFLAKYVRPQKVDGCLLPAISGKEAVMNTWVASE